MTRNTLRYKRIFFTTVAAAAVFQLGSLGQVAAATEPEFENSSTSAATAEVEVTTNEQLAPKEAAAEVTIAAEIAGAPVATGPSKVIDTLNGVAAPVPGTDVTVVLPGADVTSKTKTGTVLEGAGTSQAVAQDVGEDGRRVTFVINNATDPTEYPLTFRGAESITQTATGTYLVFDKAGEVITEIGQPYAVDALGNSVSTHYVIEGTTLVQVVDHNADGVVHPVAADPTYRWAWNGVTVYLNRAETKNAYAWGVSLAGFPLLKANWAIAVAAWLLGSPPVQNAVNSMVDRGYCLGVFKGYFNGGRVDPFIHRC